MEGNPPAEQGNRRSGPFLPERKPEVRIAGVREQITPPTEKASIAFVWSAAYAAALPNAAGRAEARTHFMEIGIKSREKRVNWMPKLSM